MDCNKKYLNIPVPMLRNLHINSKQFFNDVFDVGIYLYSTSLNGKEIKRYNDALKFLGITQGYIPGAIENAKSVLEKMPKGYPIVGINKTMLFDYYKNEKDSFDIACLGAFLGLKSIIGKKPYCKTNKAMIHARMFGYSTIKDLPAELNPVEKKFQVRWHMDKVLLELQVNWFLKLFSNHQRGMYVSFDLSLDELALKSEADKPRTKINHFKVMKKKAMESATTQLNQRLTTH